MLHQRHRIQTFCHFFGISEDAVCTIRSAHAKLIVNFSHESDVTSLDPFLFYYCVPHKLRRGILLTTNAYIRHLLDSLVSALAVYATAFRSRLSLG